MDKNQICQMLAEINAAANFMARMKGIMGVPTKAPIVAMIIQNLHEALLALDKGVDVEGVSISPEEIGEGLENMLDHLSAQSQWEKLQKGLSAVDVNHIVKLTGQIRAVAHELKNNA